MKKGIIYSFIISMFICMIMPFSVFASTTGNQVNFTNNTSYSGNIKLYRVEIQPQTGYTGNTYTYGYYFQTDPGMYGLLSGNFDNNNNDVWSVAVQNGISEMFYSNKTSCYLKSATLVEYNQTLPQEVIDYIANIDSNVELTSDLIDKLVNFRQWNIPYESWSLIYSAFRYGEPEDNYSNGYNMNFPIFRQTQGNILVRLNMNRNNQYVLIAGLRSADASAFSSQYQLVDDNGNSGWTISKYETLQTVFLPFNNSTSYVYISKITFTCNVSENYKLIPNTSNLPFIPIYFNLIQNNLLSTDFALIFGLSNKLLDDIHLIAQGSQQSQSAAGDLEQGTSDLASDISSYNQIESDYNNQMNQALNNIDFSDQFSNNQNFLSGASFVKTVFNSFMQIDILRIFFIVLCIVLIAKRFI